MFERLSSQAWVGSLLVIMYPSILTLWLIEGLHFASSMLSGHPYFARFLSRDGMILNHVWLLRFD